ncbi:MAG: hypothetical protein ACRDZZ_01365 [Ilumatobacteraceae bacterium]
MSTIASSTSIEVLFATRHGALDLGSNTDSPSSANRRRRSQKNHVLIPCAAQKRVTFIVDGSTTTIVRRKLIGTSSLAMNPKTHQANPHREG